MIEGDTSNLTSMFRECGDVDVRHEYSSRSHTHKLTLAGAGVDAFTRPVASR